MLQELIFTTFYVPFEALIFAKPIVWLLIFNQKKNNNNKKLSSFVFICPLQEASVSAGVIVSGTMLTGSVTLNKWVPKKKKKTFVLWGNRGSKGSSRGQTPQSNYASFAQNGADPGDKLCGRLSGKSRIQMQMTAF